MTPMASISKAMYDWYKGDQAAGTVYTLTGGRWYHTTAPENPTFPYIVCDLISGTVEKVYASSHKWIERQRVQCTIISDETHDATEAMQILDALRTRFDDAVLTFSGSDYVTMRCHRSMPAGPFAVDGRMMATQDYIVSCHEV